MISFAWRIVDVQPVLPPAYPPDDVVLALAEAVGDDAGRTGGGATPVLSSAKRDSPGVLACIVAGVNNQNFSIALQDTLLKT